VDTWIAKVQDAIDTVNDAKRYSQVFALVTVGLLVYIAYRVSE
jgi:hypothetical protein